VSSWGKRLMWWKGPPLWFGAKNQKKEEGITWMATPLHTFLTVRWKGFEIGGVHLKMKKRGIGAERGGKKQLFGRKVFGGNWDSVGGMESKVGVILGGWGRGRSVHQELRDPTRKIRLWKTRKKETFWFWKAQKARKGISGPAVWNQNGPGTGKKWVLKKIWGEIVTLKTPQHTKQVIGLPQKIEVVFLRNKNAEEACGSLRTERIVLWRGRGSFPWTIKLNEGSWGKGRGIQFYLREKKMHTPIWGRGKKTTRFKKKTFELSEIARNWKVGFVKTQWGACVL